METGWHRAALKCQMFSQKRNVRWSCRVFVGMAIKKQKSHSPVYYVEIKSRAGGDISEFLEIQILFFQNFDWQFWLMVVFGIAVRNIQIYQKAIAGFGDEN
jgi:transposase-like protein